MVYDENSVATIAINYSVLKTSLQAIKEAREGSDGAIILDYVVTHYNSAQDAINKLKKEGSVIQERLKLGELENQLLEFANLPIGLPFHSPK